MKKEVLIDERAAKELDKFPEEVQLAFVALFRDLGEVGELREPESKKMAGYKNLFELRVRLFGQWRAFYCYLQNNEIIILHAVQKKTQKTEKRSIETAVRRSKHYI